LYSPPSHIQDVCQQETPISPAFDNYHSQFIKKINCQIRQKNTGLFRIIYSLCKIFPFLPETFPFCYEKNYRCENLFFHNIEGMLRKQMYI